MKSFKQKAIEVLKSLFHTTYRDDDELSNVEHYNQGIRDCMDRIDAIEEEELTKQAERSVSKERSDSWIPVEERLPEAYQKITVYLRIAKRVDKDVYIPGCDDTFRHHVSYWMPEHQPPK